GRQTPDAIECRERQVGCATRPGREKELCLDLATRSYETRKIASGPRVPDSSGLSTVRATSRLAPPPKCERPPGSHSRERTAPARRSVCTAPRLRRSLAM